MTRMITRLPAKFAETTAALKRNKFNAQKTELDGFKFDSKKEAGRYAELKLLEKAGEIFDLRLQPKYDLVVNGQKVCGYIGDFAYVDKDGLPVTEDAKSEFTAKLLHTRIKLKLFKALFGRDVRIV